jgi:cobalt-zinc-cadmium efflux system outer membrane protein
MVSRQFRTRIETRFLFALLTSGALALPALAGPTPQGLNEEPTGPLTLSSACAAALTGSPALASFSWQLRASEARLLQAGLRPNPSLSLEVEDVVGTGDFRAGGEAQTTLQLSQVIELGGKRTARSDAATAARDVKIRDYEVRRVEVLADTAEKFIEVLALQHEVALTRESTTFAEAALSAVRRRVRAGKTSMLEEKKALVALARYRIDGEHARHELASARRRLAATWGSTTPAFTEADGDLFLLATLPSFEDVARLVSTSPEIARWVSAERLRATEIGLAEAHRIPNLTASGGLRRLEGPDAETLVFQLEMPLPIFDRNQGRVDEAQARQEQTLAEKRTVEIRLSTVLFSLYQELRHAKTAFQSLQDTILPEAKDALSLAQEGFGQGRFSYLELIDAQRTFAEVEGERIEVAAAYQQLLLGIERLIGQPLHDNSPYPD